MTVWKFGRWFSFQRIFQGISTYVWGSAIILQSGFCHTPEKWEVFFLEFAQVRCLEKVKHMILNGGDKWFTMVQSVITTVKQIQGLLNNGLFLFQQESTKLNINSYSKYTIHWSVMGWVFYWGVSLQSLKPRCLLTRLTLISAVFRCSCCWKSVMLGLVASRCTGRL